MSYIFQEAYDYIGSSRVVYDIHRGKFPGTTDDEKETLHKLEMNHIDMFIEVNQLAITDGTLYLHTDNNTMRNNTIRAKVWNV